MKAFRDISQYSARFTRFAASVATALVLANSAHAASGTWTLLSAGNASGNWIDTTTANWSGGTVAGGSGSTADFSTLDITANSTVTLTAPRTIGTLIFGDTSTSTAANWSLAGTGANILTLAGGTPTITVNAMASSAATSANVTISAQISGTSGLIKNGTGTNSATTTNSVNGTGTLTINSASNNYSGTTDIQTGTLRGTNASSFGTSTVTVENGGRLFLSGTGVTYANAVNLNGTDALAIGGGGLATVNLSNTVTLQSNSTAWVTNVGGNSTLTFSSAGTLALGNNVLSINSAGSTATTIAGTLTGGATSGININGGATTTMSGNGSGYSGTTTTMNGNGVVIQLGSDTALGTGTLALTPGNNNTVTVRSLDATARTTAAAVTVDNSITPTFSFGSAGTGNLTFTSATDIALASVRTIEVLNSQTEFDAAFTGAGGGITTKVTTSTGTLVLNGANTYTGATTISAGTLQLGNGGTTGKLSTNSAITNNSNLTIKRSNAVAQGTDFSTAAISGTGSFIQAGTGATTLNAANTYTGTTTVSAGSLIAGAAAPSGSAGAFGNAASAVTLGAAATTANNSSASLLTGGAFTIARAVTIANQATSGTYTIGGNTANTSSFTGLVTTNQNLTVSQVSSGTLNVTGGITGASAGTKTVTFNNAGAVNVSTTGISDGATGNVAVSQSGAGTTTVSVASGYTGATTVSAGTLLVSGGLTATSGIAVSGGTLQLGAANVLNNSAALTLSGGTFSTGATTGFSETIGTLDLNTASTITLALGTGVHSLNFADSHLIDWTGSTLTITGWSGIAGSSGTSGKIFFGSNASGLSSGQLSQIQFSGGYSPGATILSTGEIVAVPEPSTWALLTFSLTTVMVLRRRRSS